MNVTEAVTLVLELVKVTSFTLDCNPLLIELGLVRRGHIDLSQNARRRHVVDRLAVSVFLDVHSTDRELAIFWVADVSGGDLVLGNLFCVSTALFYMAITLLGCGSSFLGDGDGV